MWHIDSGDGSDGGQSGRLDAAKSSENLGVMHLS